MKTIIIWLICAFISFGCFNADVNGDLNGYNSRENYSELMGISLISGPLGLLISPFVTGFYKYGWSILPYPEKDCFGNLINNK